MPKQLPYSVILVIVFKCITAVVYATMVYRLLKVRPKSSTFRSSFYTIFLMQSIADFFMFFYMELIYRPRQYDYFDWFNTDMDTFAQWSLLLILVIRLGVTLGHVVIAFNRFTIFRFPTSHAKIWSERNVALAGVVVWVIAFMCVFPFWVVFKDEIVIVEAADGTLQLSAGQLSLYTSYSTNTASLLSVLSCAYFYGYAIMKSSSLPNSKKAVERRLLVCGVLSFLPFVLGFVRVCLVLYGRAQQMPRLVNFGIYVWTFEEPAMFMSQVVVQMCINKSFRQLVVKRGKKENTAVVTVAGKTSEKNPTLRGTVTMNQRS